VDAADAAASTPGHHVLPRAWRARVGLRVGAGIVRQCAARRSTVCVRRDLLVCGLGVCAVRAQVAMRLYATAAAETLALFGMPAHAHVEARHAVQGGSCRIALDLGAVSLPIPRWPRDEHPCQE
jgi:hypothetical protein